MAEIREKVYDPDPDRVYSKAKQEKSKKEYCESNEDNLARNQMLDFPQLDSGFTTDFASLPSFFPNDCLEHLKNCGKSIKNKSENEALAEEATAKGLKLLGFVHDVQVNQPENKNIIYLRALCWAS